MTAFVRRYEIEPYGTALYVVMAPTVSAGIAQLPKVFASSDRNMEDAQAVTLHMFDDNIIGVVFAPNDKSDVVAHRTIAHECWHATDCIMKKVGVRHRLNDANEPFAYICGVIAEKVYMTADEYCKHTAKRTRKG